MDNYYSKTLNFLKDAEESIERVQSSRDIPQLKRNILNFLNATKHCYFPLYRYKGKIDGYEEWSTWKQKELDNNLAKYFYEARNIVAKQGGDIIDATDLILGKGGGCSISSPTGTLEMTSDGEFISVGHEGKKILKPEEYLQGDFERKITWCFKYIPKEFADKNPIGVMQSYLAILNKIATDFNNRFNI